LFSSHPDRVVDHHQQIDPWIGRDRSLAARSCAAPSASIQRAKHDLTVHTPDADREQRYHHREQTPNILHA
jgi:hypothetical protein